MGKFSDIKQFFKDELGSVYTTHDLLELKSKFLGKNSVIASESGKLRELSPEARKEQGVLINELRKFIEDVIIAKEDEIQSTILHNKLKEDAIDITLPGRRFRRGQTHPVTATINRLKEIFSCMGFYHVEDREIEEQRYNFDALNIPESHPARQMHDTFYIKEQGVSSFDMSNLIKVIRTHTSSVQIRYMEANEPPLRIISSGRVYRADHDATHAPMFHQLEGLVIEETSNFAQLKGCISTLLKEFFEIENLPIRWRSSYFPFTEPSAEIDVKCDRSIKSEIKVGEGNDWLEILGCGMVHYKVLQNVGIDPSRYQGFAFGVGIERLAMLKYGIADLRDLYEGDMRWHSIYGL
jgi:phenylalanyl-tRNA synthetase alpha chain